MKEFDLLVLGSGPAGFYTALACSRGGMKTALVEKSLLGGTGFATGCLPVKVLLHKMRSAEAASLRLSGDDVLREMEELASYGPDRVRERLEDAGVSLLLSEGEFKSNRDYEINGETLRARQVVIATGTSPASFGGIPFGENVISHREALRMKTIPGSMIIVGGDVEGIEFASLFSRLGTEVTVIEQLDRILPGYDRDLVEPVLKSLGSSKLVLSSRVNTVIERNGECEVSAGEEIHKAEKVLITGLRKPSVPEGLDGLDLEDGFVKVDANLETSIPGVYAVGDINGLLGMAGAAEQQAIRLSDYLLKGIAPDLDYSHLPRAVFSLPQICGAGLQEMDFAGDSANWGIKRFPLGGSWRSGLTAGNEDFVKVISDSGGTVRGVWFSGATAEYHGHAASLIVKNRMSISGLRRDLYIHPTEFETLLEAVI